MKIVSAVLKAILCLCGWAGIFLACRVGVWLLGWPVWWCVPGGLLVGCGWLAAKAILAALRRERETLASAKPRDPKLSGRFRAAWKRGQPFRKSRLLFPGPELPWFISLDVSPALHGHLPELADAVTRDSDEYGDEFTWRRGPEAAWVDFPQYPDDDRWRGFTAMLQKTPQLNPPAGVVLRLDCARLLNQTHTSVHDDAARIRRRLDLLQKACRRRLPFYLVVDNIDRLYGLRSVIARMEESRLRTPLGGIRKNPDIEISEFVSLCLDTCLHNLGPVDPDAGPAALQAPDEIRRLEAPLIALVAQLAANSETGPYPRGLFLAAATPGGDCLPPLLSRLMTFQPVEETLPVQPWFLRELLRHTIPADSEAARIAAGAPIRFAYPAAAAGLMAGSVALCLLMTCSFLESRGVLLSARGRASAPATAETLQPYLELASNTRLRNNGWRLPRFGMTEPVVLADVLRQRYTESYFDLKTIPSIEHVQDAAIEAAESTDPAVIGNALLLLSVTRDGIGRSLPANRTDAGSSRFLHTLVESLGLATPEDMRQLETYFAWAGHQDWMPETHAALIDFEKYILDNAATGDLSWLPDWINCLPGLHGIDTAKVWDYPPDASSPAAVIGPAWTVDGYRIADGILKAVVYDPEKPDAWRRKCEHALARHRSRALEEWRKAAEILWDDFRARTPDGKIPDMFRDAARGDDPAGRFLTLVEYHLLPMFDDIPDEANPDLHRLRLHAALRPAASGESPKPAGIGDLAERLAEAIRELGREDGIETLSARLRPAPDALDPTIKTASLTWTNALRQAVLTVDNPDHNLETVRSQFQAWNNPGYVNFSGRHAPLDSALEPAGTLHRHLRDTTGSGAWDGLSPLATLDYMRYLATRQAALKLDALWREQVYYPAQLAAGSDDDRMKRLIAPGGPLEKFLTGPATGFWRWDGEKIANAEWNRLGFMLDEAFLEFCGDRLRSGISEEPAEVVMPFQAKAVHVGQTAKEHPVAVEYRLETDGREQLVTFRNYMIRDELVWVPCKTTRAQIRIVFPSITASVEFTGEEGVREFLTLLESGTTEFDRSSFPDVEAALGRMGIQTITLRTTLDNTRAIHAHTHDAPTTIPASIVIKSTAPDVKPSEITAYGLF